MTDTVQPQSGPITGKLTVLDKDGNIKFEAEITSIQPTEDENNGSNPSDNDCA